MNKSRPFHEMQTVDLDIAEQTQRLRIVEASLGETEELWNARRAFQKAEGQLQTLQRTLQSQEMDQAGLTSKIEVEEARLYSGNVKNPKELSGIQEEVWYLKRRREALEEEMLGTMLSIDEAEHTLSVLSGRLKEVETRWADDQARLQEERRGLLATLAELAGRRENLVAAMPHEDVVLYEELRAKKAGQAVAILERGICRGCGVSLPTIKAWQAQRGQTLTFCDNCGRILHPLS